MKILVLSHNYPRSPDDPAGAFVARLAKGVADAGHQVTVLAPHGPGLPLEQADGAARVLRFRYADDARETVHGNMLRSGPIRVWRFIQASRAAARRVAAESRPDVVHAHWWLPGGWAAQGCGAPYVVTCHGTDVRLLERPLPRWLGRRVLRDAAAVTTVSEFLGRDVARLLGDSAPRTSVLRMPVPQDGFAGASAEPKASPARVLYVGNLNPSKGVDVLIRAAALLKDGKVVAHLRVIGDGPARADLERLARELGIADRVAFAGRVPSGAMPREYAAATVTVLPTRGHAEGLGLALVESLLAGTAVVGSPAGGIPEVVVDGETGLIARDGDAGHLAGQLGRILTDRALRERTASQGRARVAREFSPEAAVATVIEIYRGVAGRTAA